MRLKSRLSRCCWALLGAAACTVSAFASRASFLARTCLDNSAWALSYAAGVRLSYAAGVRLSGCAQAPRAAVVVLVQQQQQQPELPLALGDTQLALRLAREQVRAREDALLAKADAVRKHREQLSKAYSPPGPEPRANLDHQGYLIKEVKWLAIDVAQVRLTRL